MPLLPDRSLAGHHCLIFRGFCLMIPKRVNRIPGVVLNGSLEFVDNLDELTTNSCLFAEYCLPSYQRYTEILHGQGKKAGSHMDGNVKTLLNLLSESGLDVCESFSPFPLTSCIARIRFV